MVVVEFTVGGLAYKYRDSLEDITDEGLKKTLSDYGTPGRESLTKNVDDLQMNLKCCGAQGPKDWRNLTKAIPSSCCADKAKLCDDRDAYQEGCVRAIKETLAPAMKVLAITVIVFAVIQLLGIFGSCCVASCIKRASYDHV